MEKHGMTRIEQQTMNAIIRLPSLLEKMNENIEKLAVNNLIEDQAENVSEDSFIIADPETKTKLIIKKDESKLYIKSFVMTEKVAQALAAMIFAYFFKDNVRSRLEKEGYSYNENDIRHISTTLMDELLTYDDFYELQNKCINYIASEKLHLNYKLSYQEALEKLNNGEWDNERFNDAVRDGELIMPKEDRGMKTKSA